MPGRQRSPPPPSCFWLPRRFNMAPRTPRLGGPTRTELLAQNSTASASSPRQDVAQRSTRPPLSASRQSKPGDQSAKQPWRSQEKVNSSATSGKTSLQTPPGPQVNNPQAPTLTGKTSRTKSHGSSAPPRMQAQVRLQVSTPASQPKSPTREASLVEHAKLLVDDPKQSKLTTNEIIHDEANANGSLNSNQNLPAETSSLRHSKSYRKTESNGSTTSNQADIPNTGQGTETEEQIENKQLSSVSETQQARSPARKKGNGKEQDSNCSVGKERKIVVSTMPQASFSDGGRATFGKDINEGLSRLAQQVSIGRPEQQAVNIITFAGKSKGASMAVGHEPLEYREGDGIASIINNNVETINNSALHGSTCNVRDPGVHLDISAKPIKILDTKPEAAVAPKTERAGSNRTLDQTPNQGPRVRRRCLRALFMESSDSDPENPQKPRRHGCRYSCEGKKKSEDHNGRTSTSETMRGQHKQGANGA